MLICAASPRCPRPNPPAAVIAALDAWFDRIAGSVHAFGGEVLKFIGDGMLRDLSGRRGDAPQRLRRGLRAVSAARAGMAHLDGIRRRAGAAALAFGAALHLGEMFWGNSGRPTGWTSPRSVLPSIW